MPRALLVLSSPDIRAKAIDWIKRLPDLSRVEFKKPRRSIPQNDLLWARLTELSEKLIWHGQRYSPEDWKDYLMHALKKARWMPGEDGGMVPIGMHTSDLSKGEFTDLLDLMDAFAARHGVYFNDPAHSG